jgi:hypothetical protein
MKEAELAGWIAVAVSLTNQFLVNTGIINLQKSLKLFWGMNLLSNVLLLITALLLNFMPLIVLEIVVIVMNVFRFLQVMFR